MTQSRLGETGPPAEVPRGVGVRAPHNRHTEPELVGVGKARGRNDDEAARRPVSEAAAALAFGEIDYSFPVDESP